MGKKVKEIQNLKRDLSIFRSGFFVLCVFFLILSGVCIYAITTLHNVGHKVCEQNGYGDFRGFDNSESAIKCEPAPLNQKHDCSYIKVVNGNHKSRDVNC